MSFWAALGQVAAPMAMSALGGMLGKGEAGQSGYDVVQMPQYDWTQSSLQGTNDYLMQMLDAMKKGKEPAWMSEYMNQIQGGMQQDLSNRFYGSAGRPGMLRDMMGAGAITGIGPKAAMSKGMQATADYMSEADKIDQYISGLKYNTMRDYSTQIPNMIMQQPTGPQSQIVPYGGGGTQSTNPLAGAVGAIPWESVFKSGGGSSGLTGGTSQYSSGAPQLTGSFASQNNMPKWAF